MDGSAASCAVPVGLLVTPIKSACRGTRAEMATGVAMIGLLMAAQVAALVSQQISFCDSTFHSWACSCGTHGEGAGCGPTGLCCYGILGGGGCKDGPVNVITK